MISEQLTHIRKLKKLTMKEVAEAIGVSLSAYQKYENGTRDVSTEVLSNLADFYGVTTDYLLGKETSEQDIIDELAKEFNMSALELNILNNYLSLPDDMRAELMDFLNKSVADATQGNN